jgi:hypothetical protein
MRPGQTDRLTVGRHWVDQLCCLTPCAELSEKPPTGQYQPVALGSHPAFWPDPTQSL